MKHGESLSVINTGDTPTGSSLIAAAESQRYGTCGNGEKPGAIITDRSGGIESLIRTPTDKGNAAVRVK